MAYTALVLIVAGIVAGECGRLWWFLDLFSHFQVQYLVILAGPILWFGFRKKKRRVGVGLVACVWLLWKILPLWLDTSQHSTGRSNLKLMSVNVYAGNSDYDAVLDVVGMERPDIVVFQEVTTSWAAKLKSLREKYPHSKIDAREDAFGMAMFSRFPFEMVETKLVGQVPWIEATVNVEGSKVTVLSAHTLPPMGEQNSKRRNSQLKSIVATQKRAAVAGVPLIVAGDLNCTPWSPHMRDALHDGKLVSTRHGFGVLPSWPARRPVLWIPIDHVLVSPEIGVVDFRTGGETGSDHLPLIVDLVLQ